MRLNDAESKKAVVVTGTFPALQPGETIAIEGNWGSHPKYGKQFQATSFEYLATDDNDIVEYLASGQFPGVGQKIAERIVEIFGDNTADILDNHPDKFRETKIKGFPARKVEAFLARWQEARHSRETMLFLYKHEIVGSVAKRLWNKFGQATMNKNYDHLCKLLLILYNLDHLDLIGVFHNRALKHKNHNVDKIFFLDL